ncbi:hypothetical protein [Bacillus suaedaesalsae]|uniref:Lipoprotein n=1 Tax=Bacillus suaedaesalsae TaxID=2810349 RepID=A0ABS2DH87_9BACI|nr:hypothetical protein [Bacillus suaedaesalsae]MBM6617819.1 hypothetical protein [Bacillus suaedaesalsae]
MKKIINLTILLMLLAGCDGHGNSQLERIEVQKVSEEGNYEETIMITDMERIDLIKETFIEVNWEPNTKAEMARKEDLLAALFYSFDKNMPERLYEYRIWFNSNETATIISNNEKEGYGKLDKENAEKLKENLLN